MQTGSSGTLIGWKSGQTTPSMGPNVGSVAMDSENPAWPLKVVRKSERRTRRALASRTRVVRLKARLLKGMQIIRGEDQRGLRLEDRPQIGV